MIDSNVPLDISFLDSNAIAMQYSSRPPQKVKHRVLTVVYDSPDRYFDSIWVAEMEREGTRIRNTLEDGRKKDGSGECVREEGCLRNERDWQKAKYRRKGDNASFWYCNIGPVHIMDSINLSPNDNNSHFRQNFALSLSPKIARNRLDRTNIHSLSKIHNSIYILINGNVNTGEFAAIYNSNSFRST